jgi:hypothetical protein
MPTNNWERDGEKGKKWKKTQKREEENREKRQWNLESKNLEDR